MPDRNVAINPVTTLAVLLACCTPSLSIGSSANHFAEDGFAQPLPTFSSVEMETFRTFLDKVEREEFGGKFATQTTNLHLQHEPFWRFLQKPQLLQQVSNISNIPAKELRIMATTILVKYPTREGEAAKGTVGWHQDLAYWNLQPQEAMTAWLAVDNVTEDNGCMQMLPKMHSKGELKHEIQDASTDNVLMNKQAIPEGLLVGEPVCVKLRPGEMSMHGGWTPHFSGPNRSPNRRLGVVINWIRDTVRVGPSLYDLEKDKEWRLPVDPTDETFPPTILNALSEVSNAWSLEL